jgi:integrase/recombinase XerD
MKSKVALLARVKQIVNGKPAFGFETVETIRKGKPVQPKEPKDAVTRVTSYYLRFTEAGKRVVKPAGSDFEAAVVTLRNKELQREYTARGVDAPDHIVESSRVTIAGAAAQFLANQKTLDKSDSTVYGYTRAVEQFQTSCTKIFLDQIDRQDILNFIAWMKKNVPTRDRGQQNGTIRTRLAYLSVFLLENKIENPLPKREWPKTDEREVEAFTTEEINQLISKASIDETDLILFLLYTGFRDDEVAHTYYSDVNFAGGTINISNKPELDFTIKNRKQRKSDITLPADFLKRLKERRERSTEGSLIFPNSKGGPDTSLLTRVRAAAEKSGYTKYFGLHKFRKTFGTIYGERVGIVNAQHALGHADIRTTQKYLAKTKVSAAMVEEMFAGVGD